MIIVAPSAEFETSIDWGVTGLEGTLRVSLLDGAGGTATAATTSGVAEFPANSGRYEVTLTAPGTGGQYAVFWDDGSVTVGHTAPGDDLLVTSDPATAAGGTSNLYITASELKASTDLTNETFLDDLVDDCVAAASRAIDNFRRDIGPFFPSTQTRYYTPQDGIVRLPIHVLNTLTTLSVDMDGDGTWEDTWAQGTEFWLEPTNAVADGIPYHTVALILRNQAYFPRTPRSVKITGSFGWAETPIVVKQAARLLATKLVQRKDTPYGILVAGQEMVAAAKFGSLDPDAAQLLRGLPARNNSPISSIQLN
jgi:hypothetical protein